MCCGGEWETIISEMILTKQTDVLQVERGFLMYQTGKIQSDKERKADIQAALEEGDTELAKELKAFHTRIKTFSEPGWGKATQEYSKAIIQLSERAWGGIMKAGMKHVRQSKTFRLNPAGYEEEAARAMMLVDSGYESSNSD